jgi:hypothetical protein
LPTFEELHQTLGIVLRIMWRWNHLAATCSWWMLGPLDSGSQWHSSPSWFKMPMKMNELTLTYMEKFLWLKFCNLTCFWIKNFKNGHFPPQFLSFRPSIATCSGPYSLPLSILPSSMYPKTYSSFCVPSCIPSSCQSSLLEIPLFSFTLPIWAVTKCYPIYLYKIKSVHS